jgi:cytochrome c oxidase assembly protein subunit 15
MRELSITPKGFLRVAQTAFASLYLIIITGSLVRLTGSGLGCADWPRCSESKFVDVSNSHAAIEQVNRLFTGVVAASVILAVLLSIRLRPKRRDLVGMSIGLVVGVLAQVLLGGLVVLTGLNPFSNIAHFLVSMLLMSNAYMLLQHARIFRTQEAVLPRREPEISNTRIISLVRIVLALSGAAVVTGTVVTGSGPHAGDENAIRIDLAINLAAKIHSITVITCLTTALVLFFVARRDPISWRFLAHPLERFLAIGALQGLIGYVQYFSGLPVLLVAIHVALSVAVWLGALDLYWYSKLPKAS